MLRDLTLAKFTSVTRLLGRDFPTPLVVAPIGVQAQLNPKEADYATAAAASELDVPFTLSSVASRPMEQVYKAGAFKENQTDAWFQFYWPIDDEFTESLLTRAKKCGYRVLVVTLDTWILGWRPRDLDTGEYAST
jgi:isopentenyl diphosphate isomerase/L-lactate dehydrogenase-like FMN-dependent dehydrogenase